MSAEQVRLRFVGSGDAFGNGGRFQTCFWLEGGPDSLLIDCGATSLTALKAAGLEPNETPAWCSPTCTGTTSAASRSWSSTGSFDAASAR